MTGSARTTRNNTHHHATFALDHPEKAMTRSRPPHSYVLTIMCPNRPGIVHAVGGFLVEHGGNILESQQFDALEGHRFFMRVRFFSPPPFGLEGLRSDF